MSWYAWLSIAAAALLVPAAAYTRACRCKPAPPFDLRPEWTGPLRASRQVDVNLGNRPEAFARAAYWQVMGAEPDPSWVAEQARKLRELPYWRRIDTVNSLLAQAGSGKKRVYSDPWLSQPALLDAPCHRVKRDVGAVFMFFFNCPGGVNGGMEWANTHALGMDAAHPLYGFGDRPAGYYDPKKGPGFFYRELLDARWAGLQFLLPNVYGPDLHDGSMENLAVALERIHAQGLKDTVKLGLFDDTWGWVHLKAPWRDPPNLADRGQTGAAAEKIYAMKWKPFFSRVPRRDWYTVKGRPYITFYNGGTLMPCGNAAAVLARCKQLFKSDFGVEPFLSVDRAFFKDRGMDGVADAKFVWDTFKPDQPDRLSRDARHGLVLDHAMVRWDSIGRGSRGSVAVTAGPESGVVKDGAL
ncbi:MAG TPA: DUF5010 domain-containing protein, partial [bacterium]|nr:DUF5010 domain-containing protein [bacterium]